ncbi:YaaC family protein [Anoxybacillus sp. J5B_2022]|uniref:YaaC family protein n=1 Tax=Anoxybacillus sp. J5B_2022 TaxID=3003246 RepID=UPI002286C3F9|nr:YaaC family protein [Anoxybacillus sp. J5B_2022]MCZ0756977.1 YaaC family protein [Anoxybacillus sp. J5B_2022]
MLHYKDIWISFASFCSANIVQPFLYRCYKKIGREDAKQKSYTNCYAFLYYLEHGQNFYLTARNSPISIQPVLLFYGMVQLLKACLLTVDADYPESTSILAHGVSTRKRKKQSYEFFADEVKIQKHGLFTHFSEKMFHVKQMSGEKFHMRALLQRIGELHELFETYYGQPLSRKVVYDPFCQSLLIPVDILDDYHMTFERFIHYIAKEWNWIQAEAVQIEGNYIKAVCRREPGLLACEPLMLDVSDGLYRLPIIREKLFQLPEIITHYLLLYNLSMISRYETEWWGELLHSYSSEAYPFIHKFLAITSKKGPQLLYEYLLHLRKTVILGNNKKD